MKLTKPKVFVLHLCINLLFIGVVNSNSAYCNIPRCKSKHIACNNNGRFGRNCPKGAKIIGLTPHQQLIVNLHNNHRNTIAGGMEQFEPAVRMATMQWDEELAKLAVLNARTCKMQHDKCHDTKSFPLSGQNVALYGFSGLNRTENWILENFINDWYSEWTDTTMDNIYSIPLETPKETGHFTVMVNEANTHVGCGLVKYKTKLNYYVLTCNYAATNILNQSVYMAGKTAASACKTGRNKKFENLCNIEEEYSRK